MGFYKERQLAEEIAQACRVLGAFDMTFGALGHISYRLDNGNILIKGKGPNEVGLRYTRPRDIVEVDQDANLVDGPADLQPPSESFLHLAVMQARPDVNCVVHTHAEYSVLMSITGKEIYQSFASFRPGSNFARAGVPIYPRSRTIGTPELGVEFAECMGKKDVAIMVGHGIASAGATLYQGTMNALALETMCRMTYKAYAIGTPVPLADAGDAGDRPAVPEGQRRPRGSAGGVEGMMATWRYYVSLAEERLANANSLRDED
jgi:ribulose-5-phosphate 4-epimerase/fuculose-1-phosphate aldolase